MGKRKYRTHIKFKEAVRKYCRKEGIPLYVLAFRLGKNHASLSYALNDVRLYTPDNEFLKNVAEAVNYQGPVVDLENENRCYAVG